MGAIAQFGMGLGLAGVAGIRSRYPLILLGLLTRYSEIIILRKPLAIFSSSIFLIFVAGLLVADSWIDGTKEDTGYYVIKIALRTLTGAVIFAGLFSGFSLIFGLIFGGAVAFLSYLIEQKLVSRDTNAVLNVLAFPVTVFLIVLPLTAYLIWAGLIFLLLRNRTQYPASNRRYRNLR